MVIQLRPCMIMSTPPPHPSRPTFPSPLTYKVYPDGADVAVREGIVREAKEQARLADPRVADQYQLEQVVTDRYEKRRGDERKRESSWV